MIMILAVIRYLEILAMISFSGLVIFGLALGMMVGLLGAGARAVILACMRGGQTDFWNMVDNNKSNF